MGLGLSEDIINELREESKSNFEEGINKEVPVYYIEGQPFKSPLLKSRYLDKDLRGSLTENLSPDERDRMELMAKSIDIVYDRRKEYGKDFFTPTIDRKAYKDIPNQDIGDYIFENTDNDLTGLFVNSDKKETILAVRGILPNLDRKDLFQFPSMIKSTFFETEDEMEFGKQFNEDKKMIEEEYRKARVKYPDHRIIAAGHSRGSRGVIFLGRKYDLEFHAFSPAVNRAERIFSAPVAGGNLYYHHSDPVSIHYHKIKGNTIEQHHESFNNRIYPHSTKDFFNQGTKLFKHPKKTQRELDEFEKELLLDMQTKPEDVITAEEFVLSDLGVFDDFKRKDYNDNDDDKKKNTQGITLKPPTNFLFYDYTPSVFNDLNLKAEKPFNPNISFEEIDGDKNNKISFNEFKKYFNKLGYDDDTIKELFETYDIDKSNTIDKLEFNSLINSI